MALGAERRSIFQMVVGYGLRLTIVGLLTGVAAAVVLLRLLSSFSQLLSGVAASRPGNLRKHLPPTDGRGFSRLLPSPRGAL